MFECPMPKIERLSERTEWIDLSFMERERTPREIIETGIRYHLAGLSLSNTVILLEDFGCRTQSCRRSQLDTESRSTAGWW